MTNADGQLARGLLLLQKPGADMLDVVEDQAPDFRAKWIKTHGS
jgi:hypothetical protein